MPKLILTVETVTPLIMNGADQTPEIRAASFRGIFRYWLRAVLGAQYGRDTSALFKEESKYWGSTERASSLRLGIETEGGLKEAEYVSVWNKDKREKEMKPPNEVVLPSWLRFEHFITDQKFNLIFSTHPLKNPDAVFSKEFYSSLLLAFHLGAFGKRSRRGGGVLRVVDVQADEAGIQSNPLFIDFQRLVKFSAKDKEQLLEAFNQDILPFVEKAQNGNSLPVIPEYPTWAAKHVKVFIGKSFLGDYQKALQDVWSISGNLHHMKGVWGFGGERRRASAVFIRVHKSTQNKANSKVEFFPMVTILRSGSGQWHKLQGFAKTLGEKDYTLLDFCKGDWSR